MSNHKRKWWNFFANIGSKIYPERCEVFLRDQEFINAFNEFMLAQSKKRQLEILKHIIGQDPACRLEWLDEDVIHTRRTPDKRTMRRMRKKGKL